MKTAVKIPGLLVGAAFILFVYNNGFDAAADCKESEKTMSSMRLEKISLINDSGKMISIETHIADNNQNRANGYQYICEDVIKKTTILFVYSEPFLGRFHMNNVNAPLDIGFFDDKGKLLQTMVMNTYEDGNKKLYHPGLPFQYALEAPVGFFDNHKLSNNMSRLVVHSVNN